MQGLGRVFNFVGAANGVGLNLSECSAVTFIFTNDDTATLTVATSLAGTYRAYSFFTPNWTPVTVSYQNHDNGAGTGTWVKVTQTAASTVVVGSDYQTAFTVYGSQLPDGYDYIKCTMTTGDGICVAILHDLTVQRAPANLPAVSA
jgi:hypothetical protein